MPTDKIVAPGRPPELLEAESCRRERAHTVLVGTSYVVNRPREIVVRRVPATTLVEEVQ